MNPYAKTKGEFAKSCGFSSYKEWVKYFCEKFGYNHIREFKEEVLFEAFNDGLISQQTLERKLGK